MDQMVGIDFTVTISDPVLETGRRTVIARGYVV